MIKTLIVSKYVFLLISSDDTSMFGVGSRLAGGRQDGGRLFFSQTSFVLLLRLSFSVIRLHFYPAIIFFLHPSPFVHFYEALIGLLNMSNLPNMGPNPFQKHLRGPVGHNSMKEKIVDCPFTWLSV